MPSLIALPIPSLATLHLRCRSAMPPFSQSRMYRLLVACTALAGFSHRSDSSSSAPRVDFRLFKYSAPAQLRIFPLDLHDPNARISTSDELPPHPHPRPWRLSRAQRRLYVIVSNARAPIHNPARYCSRHVTSFPHTPPPSPPSPTLCSLSTTSTPSRLVFPANITRNTVSLPSFPRGMPASFELPAALSSRRSLSTPPLHPHQRCQPFPATALVSTQDYHGEPLGLRYTPTYSLCR
ncbi:hypothetical protein FB451DRAFT_1394912 [Mycena latifolia]|nr:hypothetical protein FB451DRAFT_1394912 [Mycena latifolia]